MTPYWWVSPTASSLLLVGNLFYLQAAWRKFAYLKNLLIQAPSFTGHCLIPLSHVPQEPCGFEKFCFLSLIVRLCRHKCFLFIPVGWRYFEKWRSKVGSGEGTLKSRGVRWPACFSRLDCWGSKGFWAWSLSAALGDSVWFCTFVLCLTLLVIYHSYDFLLSLTILIRSEPVGW